MRTAFVETLCDLAARDERLWLITGDLGFTVLETFADRFPDRYVNAGVAEQNMTGVAAGLALFGKKVYTYSIANFPVMRCLEQIRNDIAYHQLNVTVVSVGGGLTYGSAGYTHHAIEDLAIMRAMPAMTVFAPGDPAEARATTAASYAIDGPCYLRLEKSGSRNIHAGELDFELGKPVIARPGSDVSIAVAGGLLSVAMDVADLLQANGVSTQVASLPTVKPLDEGLLEQILMRTDGVLVIEEHLSIGGVGDAVDPVLQRVAATGRWVETRSLSNDLIAAVGSQDELRAQHGLDAPSLLAVVESKLSHHRKITSQC